MPQKDLNNPLGLIADLYRETSFSVFFCTVSGMVLGMLATIALLAFWMFALASLALAGPQQGSVQGGNAVQPAPVVHVRAGPGPAALLFVVPGAVVGGIIGCLFGVLIDFVVRLLRGPAPKKPLGKKWVPERDAKTRPPAPSPLDRRNVRSHWKPGRHDRQRPDGAEGIQD